MAQLEPDLPSGYADALAEVKEKVRKAQHRAHRIVNATQLHSTKASHQPQTERA